MEGTSNKTATKLRWRRGVPPWLGRTDRFFELPLTLPSRLAILLACVLIVPAFFLPLYEMTLYSNQFPDGLVLDIYSHRLEGGKTPNRDDLREINSLNHYIGMRALEESNFTEFKWIPFGLGGAILLGLRAVVLGKLSKLVDQIVLFSYFCLFALWSFGYRLYQYGHTLEPTAAVKVAPFTPPVFGTQQVANFTVNNYPGPATYLILFAVLVLLAAVWASRPAMQEPR